MAQIPLWIVTSLKQRKKNQQCKREQQDVVYSFEYLFYIFERQNDRQRETDFLAE